MFLFICPKPSGDSASGINKRLRLSHRAALLLTRSFKPTAWNDFPSLTIDYRLLMPHWHTHFTLSRNFWNVNDLQLKTSAADANVSTHWCLKSCDAKTSENKTACLKSIIDRGFSVDWFILARKKTRQSEKASECCYRGTEKLNTQ